MKFIKYFFLAILSLFVITNLFGLENIGGNFLRDFEVLEIVSIASIPVSGLYLGSEIGLGKVFSNHPNTYIETKAGEGEIKFGRALQFGSSRDQVEVVDGTSGVFAGLAMYSVTSSKLSEGKYLDGDVIGVGKSGYITVYSEEAVNAGDPVRVRHTDHATETDKVKGNFAKTAEAGKTYLLSGAIFEKSTIGAGEAVILFSGQFDTTADV